MACHSNGADLCTDGSCEELGIWQWRKARQLNWNVPEHANVLECQGALIMIRWRAGSLARQQR
eukprot:5156398-Pyramimonas_sp.AAC.1